MRHSIISWDCSYRNFFHLVDALVGQEFPKDEYELIYVEQRSRKHASSVSHALDLKSLEDRFEEVKDKINIKIFYLGHSEETPYHLGLCNNEGLRNAIGGIISVMDGDLLLPRNFLSRLSEFHEKNQSAVVNLHRKTAMFPIGIKSFGEWTKAVIDFEKCLNACPDKYLRLGKWVNNFGPLISARKKYWKIAEGYDASPIWASVFSKSGLDVNVRLEIAAGTTSRVLPGVFAVHPWHPIGGGRLRDAPDAKRFFGVQEALTNWSKDNLDASVRNRSAFASELEELNQLFIARMVRAENGEAENLRGYSLFRERMKCAFRQQMSRIAQ